MEKNNLVNVINELISMTVDDIKEIDKDEQNSLYPNGQKIGLVKALKNLQLCLDMYDEDEEIKSLNFDPDKYLVGKL